MQGDSVSFKGIGKLDPRNFGKLDKYTKDMISFAPGILNVDKRVVSDALRGTSNPQKTLFGILVEKYNCHNFYNNEGQKEDPRVVLSLVKKVPFPTETHFCFAFARNFKVTNVADAMEQLNYSPSKIHKFLGLSNRIMRYSDATSDDVIKILHSENKDKYLKNHSMYEPYFKRHIKEKDSIKNLDEMVANGTYDAVKERKLYELENCKRNLCVPEIVDVEKLGPYSSNESNTILSIIDQKLTASILKDKTNYSENLSEIYMTTTKDNYDARSAYLKSYANVLGVHEFHRDEMDNIVKLFRRMDEDPEVMKFITNISGRETNVVGAGGILRVIDGVSPKKRELYAEHIRTILSSGEEDSVNKAIKFCALQPDTRMGKVKKGISSYISSLFSSPHENLELRRQGRNLKRMYRRVHVSEADKPEVVEFGGFESKKSGEVKSNLPAIRYSFPKLDLSRPVYTAPVLPKLADIVGGNNRLKFNIPTPVVKTENAVAEKSAMPTLPAIIYNVPKLNIPTAPVVENASGTPVLPKLKDILGGDNKIKFNLPAPAVEKTSEAVVETAKAEPKVLKKGIFVNRIAKQPSAQKLQVVSDVNNLIEKKLGKNTLADQSRSYSRSATKMRLSMLPEIFDSIKETRAQKRVAGTFNRYKSESNADALKLYTLINGRNKRLVNYMLKVRNEDGSRIYSVKDIISTVGDKEKSIRMSKLHGTPISPAEAKSMYSNMLDEQIAQHGKLPRAKKK